MGTKALVKMKKNLPILGAVLLLLVGSAFLLYPTVSEYYNTQNASKAVINYNEEVSMIDNATFQEMLLAAKEYNSQLSGQELQLINGEIYDQNYVEEMNVWNGMMGYINIKEIDVLLPIYHGTSDNTLRNGVGHVEGTALPTGEVGNHTVLTGHTGLPEAELFTNLVKLELGDTFELLVLNEVFAYEIIDIQVVLPYEVDSLNPLVGKDLVTLVTCTPYGINSHRLLVQAERIEIDDVYVEQLSEEIQSNLEKNQKTTILDFIVIIAVAVAFSKLSTILK